MRSLWLKIFSLVFAFAGVLWAIAALRDPQRVESPNNPAQILMTNPETPQSIPAKVEFDKSPKRSN